MTILDKYLSLEYDFVHQILEQSLEVKQFWKDIGINNSGLRRGRGYEYFEEYFNINILEQIKNNQLKKKQEEKEKEFSKIRKCKFCDSLFTWNETKYPYDFCSKRCSAKYSASFVNPEKISSSVKELNKKTKIIKCKNCGKEIEVKYCITNILCHECGHLEHNVKKICVVCGNEFIAKRSNVKTCSDNCAKVIRIESFKKTNSIRHTCGGIRKGSGRGKSGWYKGYWCDSSWELAWVIYSLEHNISFKRNTSGFEYTYENKIKKYFPDFILTDGTYVEIKGYNSKQWKAKLEQVKIPLKVLMKEDMKPIFEYVIYKYGTNFIELYDNSKPQKDITKQQYVWIHNDERNTWIKIEKLQDFLSDGWRLGRIKKTIKRTF